MANKKFIFNDFYYKTKKVDFKKLGTVKKSEISLIADKNKIQDNVYCKIKYDIAGYMPMMIKVYSQFYIKQSNTDIYSVYDGKSVFKLDNEYPATFGKGGFHSNNGTVWILGVTLAELTFQHLSKHVGYIYCETQNTILIDIPATLGIYYNLFKYGTKANEWIVLEQTFLDWVQLAKQLTDEECEKEFNSLKQMEMTD